MKTLDNPAVEQFIIETTLINPVSKIIQQLKTGQFRDCDIKWLDKKLEAFVEFAAKTLHVNGVMPQRESIKPAHMNDYAVQYYLKYFNQLLEYFKSF